MASFIKNMLGGNDESTQQLINDLSEKLKLLENKNSEIEKALLEQNMKIERVLNMLESNMLNDGIISKNSDDKSLPCTSATSIDNNASMQEKTMTLYFSAPTPSGEFCSPSTKEQPGNSIYRLVTNDNINGHFTMLNTTDAVATAHISVSQFVKPVCKIISTTSSIPRHIITHEEGTATMKDGIWKVTKKAQIEFVS